MMAKQLESMITEKIISCCVVTGKGTMALAGFDWSYEVLAVRGLFADCSRTTQIHVLPGMSRRSKQSFTK